jgi:hypothetical protein
MLEVIADSIRSITDTSLLMINYQQRHKGVIVDNKLSMTTPYVIVDNMLSTMIKYNVANNELLTPVHYVVADNFVLFLIYLF